jgi:Zn-dependent peptidase ImmA (M78 family)/transcriptional regulator with XRE-family HTH domain
VTAKSGGSGADSLQQADRVAAVFDKERLRQARELSRLTQTQLARQCGAFTPAAVSQWERGENNPSPNAVVTLANALRVPIGFFSTDPRERGEHDTQAFFRSLRSTSPYDRRKARARVQLARQLVRVLEDHVRLPDFQLDHIELSPDAGGAELEQAASNLRVQLDIADGPIDNVVRVLERRGIAVVRLHDVSAKIDAFSVPYPDRPIIALGADKADKARSRMDVAHELAHLAAHEERLRGNKEVEKQATQVASAFLMPANALRHDLNAQRLSWGRLIEIKATWGTSIAAIVTRARSLKFFDDREYTQLMKTMSARGWRKPNGEPGNLGRPEQPELLARAVAEARRSGLELEDLADEAALPVPQVRALLGETEDDRPKVTL